jgi:formylglycine-generating enzyme required for sulfatase activity
MTLIPPGEFLMGSTDELRAKLLEQAKEANDTLAIERIPSEGPQHRVRITQPYWLSHHEVTLGQFRQFVEQTQYKTDAERDGKGGFGKLDGEWTQAPQFVWNADLGFSQSDKSPVVNVSWNDAVAFCQWLSKQQQGLAFSLPTEAQWEYACRAGTTTAWHFGDSEAGLKKHGWYLVNSSGSSHPVGQLPPNAFGLYDMHGNLMEWCADSYSADYYASSPADDPNDHSKGARRVLRGGSWNRYPRSCRSAYRDHGGRGSRSHSLGFRVTSVLVQ